jgi:hypothetical protein
MGPDGALYTYSDGVYLLSDPACTASTLAPTPAIYNNVELRIGLGRGKTEIILPDDFDPTSFVAHLDIDGGGIPHVAPGFSLCLGVPRHASNDPTFITSSLTSIGIRHDRLLDI